MTTRIVTVKLRTEVAQAIAANKRAEKSYKGLRDEVERLDNAADVLTKMGLVSAIAAVPGAVAPAAAAVSALPGLVLTAGAAFGTLAVAVNGTGDAMKAVAEGDSEKLAEAMEQLSFEAREFVQAYRKVKPVLDQVGDRVQDAFFHELRGDLELLAERYLPTMLNQMPRLATELGKAGHEFAAWAATPGTVAKINGQFALAADLTVDWARLLRSGTALMLDLADASAGFNRGFVKGLADGTDAMRSWIATAKAQGQLNQIFDNGGRILSKLGSIAGQTGDLLMDMAANPALTDATMALLDILGMTLDIVHALVTAFGALPGPLQSAAATLVVVGGAAMLLAGRVAAMKAALMSASLKLQAIGPAGERAARGLDKATRGASRAAAAFAAMYLAGAALSALGDEAADVDRLTKSLTKLATHGEQGGELDRLFGNRGGLLSGMKDDGPFEGLVRDLRMVDDGFSGIAKAGEAIIPLLAPIEDALFGQSWTSASDNVKALDQALTQMVQNGNIREADAAFTRLLQNSGMSLDELQRLLPGYTAATAEAERKTDGLARAQEKASEKSELLAGGLSEAVRQGKSLVQIFDILNGEALNWAGALDDVEASIDDLQESLSENGKTLDATTEKGRENRQAIRDVAEAARDAAQAKYEESGSLDQANKVYSTYINQLRQTLLNAGIAKATVDELIATWAKMPTLSSWGITTPGLDSALAKVRELKRLLGSNVAAANAYHGTGYTSGMRWGGVTEYARDGLLRQAQTFSAVSSGARYAFAEPATRGEAFIPKSGDPQRSLGILDTAAGWYGHTIAPAGGAGGGGVTTVVHEHRHSYTITLSSREMVSGFRREVKFAGGNVQDFAGSRPS